MHTTGQDNLNPGLTQVAGCLPRHPADVYEVPKAPVKRKQRWSPLGKLLIYNKFAGLGIFLPSQHYKA